MVKEGYFVECIDNSSIDDIRNTFLTIGKFYKIFHITHGNVYNNSIIYRVMNDNGKISGYYSSRFISIAESRRLKLERLERL